MKLLTTDTEFHMIEGLVQKRAEIVRLPMVALRHLLADHVMLLAAATGPVHRGGKGHKVEPGNKRKAYEDARALERAFDRACARYIQGEPLL